MTRTLTEEEFAEIMDDMIARSMGAKVEMCREQPMSDNPNVVCVGYEDKESDKIQVAMCEMEGEGTAVEQLVYTLSKLPIRRFLFVSMMGEGYQRDALPDDYNYGDMREDFENNPASQVKETVLVNGVTWSGKTHVSRFATYVYDDKGVPVFGDVVKNVTNAKEDNGRITTVLSLFVKFMKNELKGVN